MPVGRFVLPLVGAAALVGTLGACGTSGGGPAPSTVATVSSSSSHASGPSSSQPSASTVTTTVTGPAASQGQASAAGARQCGNASGYSVSVIGDAHCEYALNLAEAVTEGYFAGDDPADPYPLRPITATSPTKGSVTLQCRMGADGSATCTTPGGSTIALDR